MKTEVKIVNKRSADVSIALEADPWSISADDFPPLGISEEQLWFLLHYAILVPSPLNSQPWRFRIHHNEVEVHADLSRVLLAVDPRHRELFMSCGAAVFHLRVAIEYFGRSCRVQVHAGGDDPTLVARVSMGMQCETSSDVVLLFNAIPHRRTNRLPFRADPVPDGLLTDLAGAAQAEGAWLQFVTGDDARCAVADLVAQADRILWADKNFRRELSHWLHPNRTASRDGLPGHAERFGDFMSRAGPLIVRTFDLGKGHAARDQGIALGSPALAVLGTDDDSPAAWLSAGQALARVLLQAQSEQVSASFLNQPIEIAELSPRLSEVIGRSGYPQILLGLGYGPMVEPTPRRPLKEFLI